MTSAFSILTYPPKKYPNNLLSDTQTQTKTNFPKDTDFINGQIIFKTLPNLSLLNQKNTAPLADALISADWKITKKATLNMIKCSSYSINKGRLTATLIWSMSFKKSV
jgi:hypothetical protein